MREIKFRGKRIDNNEWVYGGYMKNINGTYITDTDNFHLRKTYKNYLVYDETIGQFTGLCDKNNVEIYENMEIDNKYIVSYNKCKYILKDISNGDIIDLWRYINENGGKITKEYRKI